MNKVNIKLQSDTGSDITIISANTWIKIGKTVKIRQSFLILTIKAFFQIYKHGRQSWKDEIATKKLGKMKYMIRGKKKKNGKTKAI